MSLVLFTFGVRFLLYSVLKNPWLVLPIELMNGITFGIFYATMASYANIISPPGTEATIQVGFIGNQSQYFLTTKKKFTGFSWSNI